jgi:pyruvate-formate lyase
MWITVPLGPSNCDKSGTALKAVLKLTKHIVAYMEASKGLLAMRPYVDYPFYSCARSVAEAVAAAALMDLILCYLNNLKHMISYLLYHNCYITLKYILYSILYQFQSIIIDSI